MAAGQREYRQRIKSVKATKKITKAMELIAASRVAKARQKVAETTPYARALTQAVSAVATHSQEDHPLTTEVTDRRRAGVVVITSDRGLAGGYPAGPMKFADRLGEHLEEQGLEVVPYLVGRKAENYFRFRNRDWARNWAGFSDAPTVEAAREVADALIEAFLTPSEEGGLDEVHVVYTRFRTMVTQEVAGARLLPLEVVEADDHFDGDASAAPVEQEGLVPEYDFEPSADEVLDALLPQYVSSRIFNMLMQSAASELAARQRAMKAATDNADDLIKDYTRLANQARQADITQEISEIVGGSSALSDSK
ncbi:ATP synthase F1 subcomplex gamma subunit [Kytococcus aerolatus]|uniref:ATP synthase gamma chain n=1 Tax=Kytococcus aerolatus TaxID=592308 RepID=A0A212T635_9MICO|nr:F0F1 ATP synthase subunit gamma [Kytococcus aerolatus]SNC61523.1 ATP synthase F1 subcomplex gamma subunit [Kytococcus aerolatus]